jgi:hypothetical protein
MYYNEFGHHCYRLLIPRTFIMKNVVSSFLKNKTILPQWKLILIFHIYLVLKIVCKISQFLLLGMVRQFNNLRGATGNAQYNMSSQV